MSVADLVPRIREAAGVSETYDAVILPATVRRCIKRLLRDYNFPKSILRQDYAAVAADVTSFQLPPGFKKEQAVVFYSPMLGSWGDPLKKREGFVRPLQDYPDHYWLEGLALKTDQKLGSNMGLTLQVYYQSMDVATNEDWVSADFEDALFSLSTFRFASEQRKPELAQVFAALWQEDQRSLAIYANELEFSGLYMVQHEARAVDMLRSCRYPAGIVQANPVVAGVSIMSALGFRLALAQLGVLQDIADRIPADPADPLNIEWTGGVARLAGDSPLVALTQATLGWSAAQIMVLVALAQQLS